jgi:hypothetical protein
MRHWYSLIERLDRWWDVQRFCKRGHHVIKFSTGHCIHCGKSAANL